MASNNYCKRQKHRAKIRELRAIKERAKAKGKTKEAEASQSKTKKVDEDILLNPGKAIGLI